MSILGETLIMWDFEAKVILLKMWFFLIMSLTVSKVMGVENFPLSMEYQ